MVVVGIFVAYLTGRVLPADAHFLQVFRVAGKAAFLAYGGAQLPASIWWGKPLGVAFREILDALLYGLLTAGAFGWLWPRVCGPQRRLPRGRVRVSSDLPQRAPGRGRCRPRSTTATPFTRTWTMPSG